MLQRLVDGDPHVTVEVRIKVREAIASAAGDAQERRRSVADLRARATAIRKERQTAAAERREAERHRKAEMEEKARRVRLSVLVRRGERAWDEVDAEIARRSAASYERAVSLLRDLGALAEENGSMKEFSERVLSLQDRHERKRLFIECLAGLRMS